MFCVPHARLADTMPIHPACITYAFEFNPLTMSLLSQHNSKALESPLQILPSIRAMPQITGLLSSVTPMAFASKSQTTVRSGATDMISGTKWGPNLVPKPGCVDQYFGCGSRLTRPATMSVWGLHSRLTRAGQVSFGR